ncbi:MAG: hypothetical protein A2735_01635 [Candidatus Yanofskybacteria bacterium RIFCSPHIGHO2_01_FULL_41_21]|uniref:Uncharacterized protein n=1 Tax=Candidatus Yanofskybacteria bacterium RIFCSPHIGHO2_01_FULL_41_21 TaxID=1802660 RepID=A0A1F8EB61_9BACT|nr:MAG: hypothetical protein A2735_01635 [Candidatus Yanofskybacteria bacterium RIFCSPHIGHO2_01_FULL_41_21]
MIRIKELKKPDIIENNPIRVGRKKIAGIAKESLDLGIGNFSEAFDVDELTDQDVQDFLNLESGKLDIVDFEDRSKNFKGVSNSSQKELWGHIGSVLRKNLDRR